MLFYADDLLIYTPLPPAQVIPMLAKVFDVIKVYGCNVGLKINLDKSAFLVKGHWHERLRERLRPFGVEVRTKVKYLGILIGHVSSEEAFVPIFSRAANRAAFMRLLSITFSERIALFQEWVPPLFIFPARAYFPTDQVVAQLAVVYKTALKISSWGLTLPILESPPSVGGNNLPRPRTFLLRGGGVQEFWGQILVDGRPAAGEEVQVAPHIH